MISIQRDSPYASWSINDCLIFGHIVDVATKLSMLPTMYMPSFARDNATHTRFSMFKKPILASLLLRTSDRRMILFSSP